MYGWNTPGEGKGYSTTFYTGHPFIYRYISFLTENVTVSYTFQRKWYPFRIPTVETLHQSFQMVFSRYFIKPFSLPK